MTKVRFAPSPTGYLHIGNIRTALVNWLFVRKQGGEFLLRIDDTDVERSKPEYEAAIREDMRWLGLTWDAEAKQSERFDRYELAKQKLIADGRLYPCYETQEELDIKRKMLLSRGLPPIYDRAALKLSEAEKAAYEAEGRKPHWRFRLLSADIQWQDLVRGDVKFHGDNLADPILIREDGYPTYTLSSVVDDAELGITHILRGEDHVTNSSVQIQLFEALGHRAPAMAHMSLIRTKDGQMSKRDGGFDIRTLRAKGLEAMSILSLLARLGTSQPIEPKTNLQALVEGFDIGHFGRAPANYDEEELHRLNAKIVSELDFAAVQPSLTALGMAEADELFWNTVRPNIAYVHEAKDWWQLCYQPITPQVDADDVDFAAKAAELLPTGELTSDTWTLWVNELKNSTGRKGKQLFMPLRKALTGMEHGPELKDMLPLIGREKIVKRLQGVAA